MSSRANSVRADTSSSLSNANENGKINVSTATVRHDSAPRQEQASSSFQQFRDEQESALHELTRRMNGALQKISRYFNAYGAIEKTMDQLSSLNLIVSEKDAELQKKNSGLGSGVRGL